MSGRILFYPSEAPKAKVFLDDLNSPLITLPAFRRRVARLLQDRHVIGQVEIVNNEEIFTGVIDNDYGLRSTLPNDPLCPPKGTKASYRVCDACAYGLSALDGAPPCRLFWPEKERDRAVTACAAFLHQYGHRFQLAPRYDLYGDPYHVRLSLPILDRPAALEDMHRGEAVFSLEGQGSVRICEIPGLPLTARWKSRKDYPILNDKWDAAGKGKKVVGGYKQDGTVWQAEEVQAGGRWHRYYGFVGCYGLARVPAEEIEFPWFSPFDVGSPANSMVSFPVVLDEAFEICWMSSGPSWIWKISDPLVFRLVVRNRSAMERTLPPLLAGGDVKPPGDAVAINTRLCWMHPLAYRNPPADPWTALISKTPTPITFKRPMRPLAPGEQFEILRWDIPERFRPLRPGLYGFTMKIGNRNQTKAEDVPGIFYAIVEDESKSPLGHAPR